MIIGITSGYFNPIHQGHIEYITEAKKLSDKLICVVNNDKQVEVKKSKKFLCEEHRIKIVQALSSVDMTMLSIDTDSTIIKTLDTIKELFKYDDLILFNSGDRIPFSSSGKINTKEEQFCVDNNIVTEYLLLPKIYSSSELLS